MMPTPLFSRCAAMPRMALIVDHHRRAGSLSEAALHFIEMFAMMNGNAGRPLHRAGIFVRLVGNDGDFFDAFRCDLPSNHIDREPTFMALSAGHRDRVVE